MAGASLFLFDLEVFHGTQILKGQILHLCFVLLLGMEQKKWKGFVSFMGPRNFKGHPFYVLLCIF